MHRRSFLAGVFGAALGAATAPVSAIQWVAQPSVLTLWGDGVRDDTAALQALINGQTVARPDGSRLRRTNGVTYLPSGHYCLPVRLEA